MPQSQSSYHLVQTHGTYHCIFAFSLESVVQLFVRLSCLLLDELECFITVPNGLFSCPVSIN